MYPTLRDTLELTARKYPDRDALVYPRRDQRLTYAEFDSRVNRLATALSAPGIEKGDRVSTMRYNGTEIVLTVFACATLGAAFNPLNYRLPAGEIEFVLNDAESSLLLFEEAVERARDDLADFKRPREYYLVDGLPKTPSGKVKKYELREETTARAESSFRHSVRTVRRADSDSSTILRRFGV